MIRLTKEQVMLMHKQLTDETGGSYGLKSDDLLDSALNAPFQSFDGSEMYPSIQQKAARLGYGLIKNHPFVDGNKRIGTHVMLVFLALNGIELGYTQEDLVNIVLQIASGEKTLEDLIKWVTESQL